MNILKLELKKTNIKPYFLSAIAVFVCIMGLTYILAWVPHLDSGDKNAAILRPFQSLCKLKKLK